MRRIVSIGACGMLAACSGGGGSGGGNGGTPTPPPVPTLSVTLTPSTQSQAVSDMDSTARFTVQASYTGSTADPVVADLAYDATLLSQDGAIVQSGNSYTIQFKTLKGLAAGKRAATITFRLCREAACTTVYPGSTQSFSYALDVKLADWATRQRNAAHNGYVHASFDAAKFAKAWEFAPAGAVRFQPVAARAGTVFLTHAGSDGSSVVTAIDGQTAAERWHYSIGNVSNASAPALAGNQLMISTMFISSSNNPTVVLNADTGLFVRNFISAAQWSSFAPPTPFDGSMYIASGYYGNVVYGFDLTNGVDLWQTNGSDGKTWDGQAPAVDSRYVYYYSGKLDVIDRVTGASIKSITDPFWVWNGYSYGGTPMLGSDNHVIAYSGNGMGTYSISFPLVDYDIEAGSYRWRTASSYTVIPAVAKGVVYAASNQTMEFDAIDEATGKVAWAWPLPAGQQFTGNIVVTDNLAFVSTNSAIYAIALDGTHATVWSAPTPGWLAISPDAKLIVVPVDGASQPVKATAYSLQ